MAHVDRLLRDRPALVERIERGERDDVAAIGRSMLIAIVVCAGVFGAAIGFYRGGLQVLYRP
jgi:hypothetical protein